MARILIAEDEPRIAAFVEKGLSANGFAVTSVNDGPSAYDYAMTGDFDLMILDIGLPGMDGFTVMRKLRAEGSAIPVIVLTARDSVQDTVAGLEAAPTTTCPSHSGSKNCSPASGSGLRQLGPPSSRCCRTAACTWTCGPGALASATKPLTYPRGNSRSLRHFCGIPDRYCRVNRC